MSTVRRLVKGCRHGRLISLKRSYTPGYTPRHAKPDLTVDEGVARPMELTA